MKAFKHAKAMLLSWIDTTIYLGRYLKTSGDGHETHLLPGVSVVITCCNRTSLLECTLESFLKFNTFPITEYIVVEDGGDHKSEFAVRKLLGENVKITYLYHHVNKGQLLSVFEAYSLVRTEYVFHLEEDWNFVRSGFIEVSLAALQANKKCLYLSLRSCDDQNGHPLISSNTYNYLIPRPLWRGGWVGFGFNPSLRRIRDFRKLGYSPAMVGAREIGIGLFYFILGYQVFVNKDPDEFFIEHTGEHCSTDQDYRKA